MKTAFAFVSVALAASFALPGAIGSDYPSRPVRITVGLPVGETTDLIARIAALALRDVFKQPVVIDNHAGGSGNVAAALVAKTKRDGYTLLFVSSAFAANVSVFANPVYDPLRDFAAVARVANVHQILVVPSSTHVRTLADFIAYVRGNPGRIVLASGGTGRSSHLAAELMKQRVGALNTLHVPYKGDGLALVDLLGGHVDALIATMPYAYPHIRSGRLKALAVASLERASPLPDVPTFAESGFPGFEAVVWNGVVAPAGTPYDTIVRLSLALSQAASAASVRQKFAALGAEPVRDTPEQFAGYLRAEVAKWAKVAKASSIALE